MSSGLRLDALLGTSILFRIDRSSPAGISYHIEQFGAQALGVDLVLTTVGSHIRLTIVPPKNQLEYENHTTQVRMPELQEPAVGSSSRYPEPSTTGTYDIDPFYFQPSSYSSHPTYHNMDGMSNGYNDTSDPSLPQPYMLPLRRADQAAQFYQNNTMSTQSRVSPEQAEYDYLPYVPTQHRPSIVLIPGSRSPPSSYYESGNSYSSTESFETVYNQSPSASTSPYPSSEVLSSSTPESTTAHEQQPQKRFPCLHPGCGRAFKRRYTLQQHESKHRTISCSFPDCTTTFKRNHDKLRHEFHRHGKAKNRCSWCNKTFASKQNLRKHTCSAGVLGLTQVQPVRFVNEGPYHRNDE